VGPTEDNIQIASAESISANHLVTRNKKDFNTSQITLLSPEEWLVLPEVAALEAMLKKTPVRDAPTHSHFVLIPFALPNHPIRPVQQRLWDR
jgi:hypothetical protein